MSLFGRGYDRDYDDGFRSSRPGRSYWGRSGTPMRPNFESTDRSYGGSQDSFRTRGERPQYYGSDYRLGGYDRGYKSRFQTQHGDPFGDRKERTPMRVIRGDAPDQERGFWSRDPGGRYDTGFRRNYDTGRSTPGYRQVQSREGFGPDRTYRSYGRSYDDGWF